MTSFDRRLNFLYAIKECSSYGALYTADCGCSEGSLEDKILVPIPESSQRSLKFERICLDCGDSVHGRYCPQCALIRKTFEEIFQDFQDTSESSDDNTNVVNAPREPFVVNQDPGENSSPSPPHIDHCCHKCGDSLDGIFCRQCTCKSCGKGAHIGYNCPTQTPIITNAEPCNNQTVNELPQASQSLQQQSLFRTCQQCGCNEYDGVCFYCKVGNGTPINVSTPHSSNNSLNFSNHPTHYEPICFVGFGFFLAGNDARYGHYCTPQVPNPEPCYYQDYDEFPQTSPKQASKDRYWKIPIRYDDDEDYTIAITPGLPTKEPGNSLSMGDEPLDTIPVTESDEFIKSSVEILVPIPSESEVVLEMCDVPFHDNSPPLEASKDQIKDFFRV
ncbi:hypothetical protein Tco_0243065 [Tanacetum coccineum]